MKSKILYDTMGERVIALVFEPGEEVIAGLRQFANEMNLTSAHFTAIGAFREVTLGFFEIESKNYKKIPIQEQVEVLSLVGNVAIHKDKPKIHAHVVVGKSDGSAHGGHLMEAYVQPTLEVMVTETPHHLRRQTDETTGLALLAPEA